MNLRFDENRYKRVVHAACLAADFDAFPHGDKTVVGEKGITLSGGQKARISLARCVYADAELYVFDDTLAAVDAKVARHIYTECIENFLEDKMRLVITHQHRFLESASKVIYIESGTQVACDTYSEIMKLKTVFIMSLDKEAKNTDKSVSGGTRNKMKDEFKEKTSATKVGEESSVGLIKWADMLFYLQATGSILLPVVYIVWKFGVHGLIVFYEIELASFASRSEQNNCRTNDVNATACPARLDTDVYTSFLWYSITYACSFVLDIFASIYFFQLIVRANNAVHSLALLGVIKSPMRFFNVNSVGRILNRFSQDLGRADTLLPLTAYETITVMLQLTGAFVLALYTNWINGLIVVPACIYLVYLRQYYVRTGREIKRLESVSKSPIYNFISETMSGRSVLRSSQLDKELIDQFMGLEDNHTAVHLMFCCTTRWLSFRLEVTMFFAFALITVMFVELSRSKLVDLQFTAGDVGTTLTTVNNLLGLLQWGIRQSVETEVNLTSVERLINYAQLPQEKDTADSKEAIAEIKQMTNILESKCLATTSYSYDGSIQFDNVSFRYYDSGPPVLNQLSVSISSNAKLLLFFAFQMFTRASYESGETTLQK